MLKKQLIGSSITRCLANKDIVTMTLIARDNKTIYLFKSKWNLSMRVSHSSSLKNSYCNFKFTKDINCKVSECNLIYAIAS